MKFLVDTNVLSEGTKPAPKQSVIKWLEQNESQVAVNPIILGELQYGILLLRSSKTRQQLLKWLSAGIIHLPVLDLDSGTAGEWARLLAELKRKGHSMPVKDSLIAATARQHHLSVATRNTSGFAHAGVKVVNPFDD